MHKFFFFVKKRIYVFLAYTKIIGKLFSKMIPQMLGKKIQTETIKIIIHITQNSSIFIFE